MNNNKFRILSLDGGGVRGLFSAVIIKRIEEELGLKLKDYCDLIVGTSTGSILAAAITIDLNIDKVIDLYLNAGKTIFKRNRIPSMGLLHSKYSNVSLSKVVKKEFGNITLGAIDKPLIIVAVDIYKGNVFLQKTNYLSEVEDDTRDGSILLSDAILSSCAAPTYFNPYLINNQYLLCDGGLWANNPSIIGIIEAVSKFQKDMIDIQVLSIGTGTNKFKEFSSSSKKVLGWGFLTGWRGEDFINFLINLSSQSSTNMSMLLLNDNYLRLNTEIAHKFDNTEGLQTLIDTANHYFDEHKASILEFLQ